jgi:hypothetical protein
MIITVCPRIALAYWKSICHAVTPPADTMPDTPTLTGMTADGSLYTDINFTADESDSGIYFYAEVGGHVTQIGDQWMYEEYPGEELIWANFTSTAIPNTEIPSNSTIFAVGAWFDADNIPADHSAYSNSLSVGAGAGGLIPATASNLTADAVDGNDVFVHWNDNSDNENYFNIYVSADGNDWVSIGTVGADVNTDDISLSQIQSALGDDASVYGLSVGVSAFDAGPATNPSTRATTQAAPLLDIVIVDRWVAGQALNPNDPLAQFGHIDFGYEIASQPKKFALLGFYGDPDLPVPKNQNHILEAYFLSALAYTAGVNTVAGHKIHNPKNLARPHYADGTILSTICVKQVTQADIDALRQRINAAEKNPPPLFDFLGWAGPNCAMEASRILGPLTPFPPLAALLGKTPTQISQTWNSPEGLVDDASWAGWGVNNGYTIMNGVGSFKIILQNGTVVG